MTHRVGAKGQVVIPKDLRELVGLVPGVEVEFLLRNGEVVLVPRRADARLGGRYRRSGMAARLLEERELEPR